MGDRECPRPGALIADGAWFEQTVQRGCVGGYLE